MNYDPRMSADLARDRQARMRADARKAALVREIRAARRDARRAARDVRHAGDVSWFRRSVTWLRSVRRAWAPARPARRPVPAAQPDA